MSKLVVEVCRISDIIPHPNADKLEICIVKKWQVVSKKGEFSKDELCVYLPPDTVIPEQVYSHDRLCGGKYLTDVPKEEDCIKRKRVRASKLRGVSSFGVLLKLDQKIDTFDWTEGLDVASFYQVCKYEPKYESVQGQAEKPNSRFYRYTDIEHYQNFSSAFEDGEEVVFTEKIHGTNSRMGLILEADETGEARWVFAAGSHDVRRKEFVDIEHRFQIQDLIENGIPESSLKEGQSFVVDGRTWIVQYVLLPNEQNPNQIPKVHVKEKDKKKTCFYWEHFSSNIQDLLVDLKDVFPFPEEKNSVIIYGEIFGSNVQDLDYGFTKTKYRAFDISINGSYLDFDVKEAYFKKYGIEMVPVVYRGKFSHDLVKSYTDGKTTLNDSSVIQSKFKGREGIVICSLKENNRCSVIKGRKILKSVSVDYHERKNGTEFH